MTYELKTELSFVYQTQGEIKNGRVDLLVIKDNEVIIIDYKSDSKPNLTVIPPKYIQQLSLYKRVFTEIYPDKQIKCKIIWLELGVMQDVGNLQEYS